MYIIEICMFANFIFFGVFLEVGYIQL